MGAESHSWLKLTDERRPDGWNRCLCPCTARPSGGCSEPLLHERSSSHSAGDGGASFSSSQGSAGEIDEGQLPTQDLASPSRLWTRDGPTESERTTELAANLPDGSRVLVARVVNPPVPCRAAHQFRREPAATVRSLIEPSAEGIAVDGEGGAELPGRKLTPIDVACWLLSCKRLSTNQIGDYLGRPDAQPVLSALVRLLDFSALDLDEALRFFLSLFRLPGEAQQISRIIESFAERYAECQRHSDGSIETLDATLVAGAGKPAGLLCAETVYVLCYSLIILNVDAHSVRIPRHRKMTCAQFISGNRGIDCGADLPELLLRRLYASVVDREIRIEQREFIESSFEGWLYEGGGRCRSWNRPYVILSNSVLYYFRRPDDAQPLGLVPLEDVRVSPIGLGLCTQRRGFRLRSCTKVTRMKSLKAGSEAGFELGHHTSFVFYADTPGEMDKWVQAIEDAAVSAARQNEHATGSLSRQMTYSRWRCCLRAVPESHKRHTFLQAEAAQYRGWREVKLHPSLSMSLGKGCREETRTVERSCGVGKVHALASMRTSWVMV